ncbi:MAG: glutamate racemase [Burkholderiaceae bacterium]
MAASATAALNRNDAPIGVFDSGIGGLSVLREIRAALPGERLLYFADSAFAPYGDKPEPAIVERSLAIAGFLRGRGVKALVVACNSATAAAVGALRQAHSDLPIVGVEPGLKPAAALTRSRVVGVLATQATLASARFIALRDRIATATGTRFLLQPCVGLADAIERGELASLSTLSLVERYVAPLMTGGADTLVLGCTHYPFVRKAIKDAAGRHRPDATLVDTATPVARQLARLLTEGGLVASGSRDAPLQGCTTGSASALRTACAHLLGVPMEVERVEER